MDLDTSISILIDRILKDINKEEPTSMQELKQKFGNNIGLILTLRGIQLASRLINDEDFNKEALKLITTLILYQEDTTSEGFMNMALTIADTLANFSPEVKQITSKAQQEAKATSYSNMLQGKGTNALARISKKTARVDAITGNATITVPENVIINIADYANCKLNVQTIQLYHILAIKLTQQLPYEATAEQIQKHRAVILTVEEFMKLRGLKDKKEARKQLEETIRTLYNISIEWEERHVLIPEGKKRSKLTPIKHGMRIADYRANVIENGKAIFQFTFDLAGYLSKAYVAPFPMGLLQVNSHNHPYSYQLGVKLALHYNMNRTKENEKRISVKTLLEGLPDMPKYEDVMNNPKDGHVARKIIDPFEDDMNALIYEYGVLTNWEYCNSKGAPLTDEQLKDYSYNEWVNRLVTFEFANYPEQTEYIKKLEAKKRKAKKEAKTRDTKQNPPIAL